jgi:hypothetical protein
MEQTKAQSLVPLHAWCGAAFALTQLLGGAAEEAEETAGRVRELAARHGYRPLEAHALRLLGATAIGRGDEASLHRAETWLGEAMALARALGMQPELGHCQRSLADLFARTGRGSEARAALVTAGELFRASGMKPYAGEVEALLEGADFPSARPAAQSVDLRQHP